MKKRLIIIDANSLIHRAFHALPPLTTKKGELVNAVYGFLLVFFRAIKDFQPDYIVACFDFPAPNFRHQEYRQYKAKRPKAPIELYSQIPKVKEILKAFDVPIFEKEGFEADDIIGTIAFLSPVETIILSGDSDTLQLVNAQTKVYSLRRGIKDIALYGETEVEEKYGILPSQLLDFKALRGDPSDNIPGVLGIGEKTAAEIIQGFGTIGNLYEEIEQNSDRAKKLKQGVKEKLVTNKELAFLSKKLVTIRKDVPLEFKIQDAEWTGYNRQKAEATLRQLEFFSLTEKLPD